MLIHKRFVAKKSFSRIDHFLHDCLPQMSRSRVVKLLTDSHVKLNGNTISKKNITIVPNDVLELELPETVEASPYIPSRNFDDFKLYEDQYMLIINKPAGISVHPGSGTREDTILDMFRFHYPQVNDITVDADEDQRPGIVHRLDKDTSGVMLLAKDFITMRRLQKQFKRKEVNKVYMALVQGHVRYQNGVIDAPLARHPRNRTKYCVVEAGTKSRTIAREAVTKYSVVRQFDDFAFIKVFPQTGRTHQIRVHLAHLGNSVLGDVVYGKRKSFKRLALHAYAIAFYHPVTDQAIAAYSPFPEVFRNYLKAQYQSEP